MNKTFARKLIENPGEDATTQLFDERIEGVFWVDWREADDYIVELAAAAMGKDTGPAPEWIDGALHIRFGGSLTAVPLQFKPGEQDLTLLALNRAIAPDFEIRYVKASDGGDTLAFMVLERDAWAEFETLFGAGVGAAFARLDPDSPLFAHDSDAAPVALPKVAPANDRATEALARVKEGRVLAKANKFEEAIALFDDVLQRFGQDDDERMRTRVLMALVAKGLALTELNRLPDAIAAYDEADLQFGKDTDLSSRDLVSTALFNKSVCLRMLDRRDDQIAVIDELDRRFGGDAAPEVRETVINALRNKANALGAANRIEEQLATYDYMVARFDQDTSTAIRAEVALALNGAAFCRIMTAKQKWTDRALRTPLLRRATVDARRALEGCAEIRRVMILGNLGYALFLSGDEMASVRETQECLRLGGKDALDGQRSDAATHRVAEVDPAYEDMLQRLWDKLVAARG